MRILVAALAVLITTADSATAGDDSSLWKDIRETTANAFVAAVDAGETPATCGQAIGKEAALALVRYCVAISMATHPPCNTGNRCALIVDEIRRNCPAPEPGALPCENSFDPAYWVQINEYDASYDFAK